MKKIKVKEKSQREEVKVKTSFPKDRITENWYRRNIRVRKSRRWLNWGCLLAFIFCSVCWGLMVWNVVKWSVSFHNEPAKETIEKSMTDPRYPDVNFAEEYFEMVDIDRFTLTFIRPWDSDAVKAIILEAVGESDKGIIAVAWVIKNRRESDMSIGSSGLLREDKEFFIYKQPQEKKDLIRKIWLNVDRRGIPFDPTNGALYFENVNAFGLPPWINDVEYILTIGNHNFYK